MRGETFHLTWFDSYRIIASMSENDIQRLSQAFRALANPNRLQLFLNLLQQSQVEAPAPSCFLSTILGNLNIGAPTVSHHVKELASAGLIVTHRDGKRLMCSINPKMVQRLEALFAAR